MAGHRTVLAVMIALCSCGQLLEEDRDAGGDGTDAVRDGADDRGSVDLGGNDVPDYCFLSNGMPVCGVAGCPRACNAADCHTPTDASGVRASFSLCITLLPKTGEGCAVCDPDDLPCVVIDRGQALCVPQAVCDRLAGEGKATACLFQDKSQWDALPITSDAICPPGGDTLNLCGGTCPTCPSGMLCAGRSHRNPIGVCAPFKTMSGFVNRCFKSATSATGCDFASEACLVYKTDAARQDLANSHAFCVEANRCVSVRGALGGAIDCFDARGASL